MSDDQTLTLEESFAKAQAQAEESTLKEEPTKEETEVEAPAEEPKEEPKEDKAEADDTDLDQIDPEKLPPELRKVYKNLHKGFTQGRQKDSEARKAAEERVAKLEAQLAEMQSGKPTSPQALKFNTPQEYQEYLAEQKVKQVLQEEKINSYREQALNDYEAADERLRRPTEGKDNPAYDEWMDVSISGKLDELLAEHVAKTGSELGFDHKGETKRLIKVWEDSLNGRIKSYIEKQNQLVKDKAAKSKASNPKTSSAKTEPNKKMSLQEAMQAAQEKLTK